MTFLNKYVTINVTVNFYIIVVINADKIATTINNGIPLMNESICIFGS